MLECLLYDPCSVKWEFNPVPHNPDPKEEGFGKHGGKRRNCW